MWIHNSDAAGWHHINLLTVLGGEREAKSKCVIKEKSIKWNTCLITWWYFFELFTSGNCCMNSWNKILPCVRILEDSYVPSLLFLYFVTVFMEEGLRRHCLSSMPQFLCSVTRCPVFYKVYAAFKIAGGIFCLKYGKGFQQVSIYIIHVFTSPLTITIAIFEKFATEWFNVV